MSKKQKNKTPLTPEQKLYEVIGTPLIDTLLDVYAITELPPPYLVNKFLIKKLPKQWRTKYETSLGELEKRGLVVQETRKPTYLHGYFIALDVLPYVTKLAEILGIKKS